MRHCDDAEAAQAVIATIEAAAQRARLRPRRRGPAARRAARRSPPPARARTPRAARWPSSSPPRRRRRVLADVLWDVGKTGKIAPVAQLEPVFVGGTTVTKATLANQEVIRARGIKIGDTVLVRRAGDVIPFVAGVLDASKRTGAEREIVPPSECPVVRAAADRAGQLARALLHQRRLPGADRAAADPLGVARGGGHRGGRPGLDRAARRVRRPREAVGLLRAHEGAAARVRAHRRGLGGAHGRVDRRVARRRAAARADRAGDPDGLRGHRRAPVPGRLRVAGGGRRRGRGEAASRSRTSGRRSRRR